MGSDTELIRILSTQAGSAPLPPGSETARPPAVLPVLGLEDIVVFPQGAVPLLVDTPQSIQLVDDVVAGDRFVALTLQKNPDTKRPKSEELYRTACLARVIRMLKFPDKTVRVLVEGLARIELKRFTQRDPYLKARWAPLPARKDGTVQTTALLRALRQRFDEVLALSPGLAEQIKASALNSEDAGRFADLVATHINLQLRERQQILETAGVRERLKLLLPLAQRELQVLRVGSKIQEQVSKSLTKSQRDFVLREQLRVIQQELGEGPGAAPEIVALRNAIAAAALPPETARHAAAELERLAQTPSASPEHATLRNYLEFLAALPWGKSTPDTVGIRQAERILDAQHFGLQKVKDRLLEFISVIKLRREMRGPILCLVGPPGVGKTSLARSVAEALGRRFVRISLGGMRDEAEIRGHRRTYVGALPGRILQSIRRAESSNPVVLLDELDKIGADFRGDPAAALLEVLDPQQNATFTDHYLDQPFDLSRVLFIATANWLDPVHPALRDRLEVIELPSYTVSEKLEIARRHLLPRQLEEHGLAPGAVKFSDDALRALIEGYTRESGVRQLERELANVLRKLARRILSAPKSRPRAALRAADIDHLLGRPRFVPELAEAVMECGVALGLAWTPVGGDVLFIEAARMKGRGKLILTGSLGDVMKESARAALSYVQSHAAELGLGAGPVEGGEDVHVHVPAGATPKDGPSAGAAIIVALASLYSRRRTARGVAMTGEISLRGRVLPVGGIKEKVLAAARAGLKRVILPDANRRDWKEIPVEVRSRIEVNFVREVSQLIEAALEARP